MVWLPRIPELKSRFRCVGFDNKGMVESRPCRSPITIDQMTIDTLAIMDAADFRNTWWDTFDRGSLAVYVLS